MRFKCGEMRLQTYRSGRKILKRPFLFGSLLLLTVSICAGGGLLYQGVTYIKRLETRFEANYRKVSNAEPLNIHKQVHKRSVEDEDPPVPTLSTATGTTYIRWGRSNCPTKERTSLVYHGYAGGQYYSHTGGGSNYLCLHQNVTYTAGHYVEGSQGPAYIHGVEYRDGAAKSSLFDLSLIEQQVLQYQGVPCALCLVRSPTQLMIPSRETCPEGWEIEYTGYIMTGDHNGKHSSRYLCVDDQPQVIPGTQGDQNGAYLYVVEMSCSRNMPCEPYVNGREIRCVVCSLK